MFNNLISNKQMGQNGVNVKPHENPQLKCTICSEYYENFMVSRADRAIEFVACWVQWLFATTTISISGK